MKYGCILLCPQARRHVSPTLRLLGVCLFFVFYFKYFLSSVFFGGRLVLCSFPKSQRVCLIHSFYSSPLDTKSI